MLARGELRLLGATTMDEYRKYIEKDKALERRFQPVMVEEPAVEDTISILRGLKEKYEVQHGVRISDSAIIAAATLSDRYISERFLPDKAERQGDLNKAAQLKYGRLNELNQQLEKLNNEMNEIYKNHSLLKEEVGEDDIAEIVSRWTGIPLSKMLESEKQKILKMADRLRQRVVGQDEAIEAVSFAVRRSRAGLSEENRPIGSL